MPVVPFSPTATSATGAPGSAPQAPPPDDWILMAGAQMHAEAKAPTPSDPGKFPIPNPTEK